MHRWILAAALLCAPSLARAQSDASEPKPDATKKSDKGDEPGPEDRSFSHGGQFGLRLGVVGGYRMVFRYDQSPYCSEPDITKQPKDQQKFCGHAAPFALDTALSFAPIGGLEPYLWGRFGLAKESETNTNQVIIVGAGVRIYTMSDSAFKIFIEPAVGAELEGGSGNPVWGTNNPEYKKDMVFHLAAGPQFDVAKAVGIYANAGITTGILRSIHSNLEAQLGVQVRAP
jgi:opacity protein-like surface antigen